MPAMKPTTAAYKQEAGRDSAYLDISATATARHGTCYREWRWSLELSHVARVAGRKHTSDERTNVFFFTLRENAQNDIASHSGEWRRRERSRCTGPRQ